MNFDSSSHPLLQDRLTMSLREWLEYYQNEVARRQVRYRGVLSWKNVLDLWVIQEIVHETQPEVIVEIGCKHGGTTLWLSDLLKTVASGVVISLDLLKPSLDFPDNAQFVHGNSVDPDIVATVTSLCKGRRTMVMSDGNHAAAHVLRELQLYSPLVTKDLYFVVEDGIVDVMPWEKWVPGPLVAVQHFVASTNRFVIDANREKFILTYAPAGFLRCVAD